jgi:DNA-binding transcriptional ArsR family regulator
MVNDSTDKWDAVFSALANEYRRRTLRYLLATRSRAKVPEIRDHLLDIEEAAGGKQAVESLLYHVHLPKLAEADLITWDRDERTVRGTTRARTLPAAMLSSQDQTVEETATRKRAGD